MNGFELGLIAAGMAIGYGARQAGGKVWFDILAGCGLMVAGFVVLVFLFALEKI